MTKQTFDNIETEYFRLSGALEWLRIEISQAVYDEPENSSGAEALKKIWFGTTEAMRIHNVMAASLISIWDDLQHKAAQQSGAADQLQSSQAQASVGG